MELSWEANHFLRGDQRYRSTPLASAVKRASRGHCAGVK